MMELSPIMADELICEFLPIRAFADYVRKTDIFL